MNNSELRNKLLALEPYPEDLKDKIREEIVNTREHPLNVWERSFLAFCCAILGMILIGVGFWVASDFDSVVGKTPTYIFMALVVSVLLLCSLLVFLLLSLKRGIWRFRNEYFLTYTVFGIVLCMFVAAMIADRPVTGVDLGVLIVLGICVVCMRIETSTRCLREHMLRNELALADLEDLINRQTH